MEEVINTNEMMKLSEGLTKRNIKFSMEPLYDGVQIIVYNGVERVWDAICHKYSYGHEDGLLEVAGIMTEDIDDAVKGYLTADEILNYLDTVRNVKMTYKEALELLRDTPIDIRSTREDDIHTLYATAMMMALDVLKEKDENKHTEFTCPVCGTEYKF